jgi:hypothetical protein
LWISFNVLTQHLKIGRIGLNRDDIRIGVPVAEIDGGIAYVGAAVDYEARLYICR